MKYSEKLNGFWEEGYHFYIEFRDDRLTVRDYRRRIQLETKISYDAKAVENGAAVLRPDCGVLSRDAYGEPMTEIRELRYDNGELKLLYNHSIVGEKLYTLHKKERGPFAHIRIRDDEFIKKLQGDWYQWGSGRSGSKLSIIGSRLKWEPFQASKFHVVSYESSPEKVSIVPEDLTESDFPGFTAIDVFPDMLTTRMIVMDASVPLTVFARKNMLDKITVPEAAKGSIRSTMMCSPAPFTFMMPVSMGGADQPGLSKPQPPDASNAKPAFCPNCGFKIGDMPAKFCPECGSKL